MRNFVPILIFLSILANSSTILHSVIFLSSNTPETLSDLFFAADEIARKATDNLSSEITYEISSVYINSETDIDNSFIDKTIYFVFDTGIHVKWSLMLAEKAE